MDPRLIRQHWTEAERHVALSDKHIARQIEIIDQLERKGHSSVLARDVLKTYRMLHASHVAHRDLIWREIAG